MMLRLVKTELVIIVNTGFVILTIVAFSLQSQLFVLTQAVAKGIINV